MRPFALALLMFLTLWGANDSLGASQLLARDRHPSVPSDVYPLALRYRAQAYEQTLPLLAPPSPCCSVQPESTARFRRTFDQAGHGAPTPDLLYVLMSLQL
jgi:hypothetical protein